MKNIIQAIICTIILSIPTLGGAQNIEAIKQAAESGDVEAIGKLGGCYYMGNGVEKDYAKAFQLLEKSSQGDFHNAKLLLGRCYENGHGTKKNIQMAISMYESAYEHGSSLGAKNLGRLYLSIKDYAKAKKWLEITNESDDETSLLLGGIYYLGLGTDINYKRSIELFRNSYNYGNVDAAYWIGLAYFEGNGFEQSYNKTYELLEKAMTFEDVPSSAYLLLSKCYRFGRGKRINLEEADRLLKIASQKGNSDALAITNLLL